MFMFASHIANILFIPVYKAYHLTLYVNALFNLKFHSSHIDLFNFIWHSGYEMTRILFEDCQILS